MLRLGSTEVSVVGSIWTYEPLAFMVMELPIFMGTQTDYISCICEGMFERIAS